MRMTTLQNVCFLLLFIVSLISARALTDVDHSWNDEQPMTKFLKEHYRHRSLPTDDRSMHTRESSLLKKSQISHSRQQIVEILRQAYGNGWRPSIKHYMPSTRFGRHQ